MERIIGVLKKFVFKGQIIILNLLELSIKLKREAQDPLQHSVKKVGLIMHVLQTIWSWLKWMLLLVGGVVGYLLFTRRNIDEEIAKIDSQLEKNREREKELNKKIAQKKVEMQETDKDIEQTQKEIDQVEQELKNVKKKVEEETLKKDAKQKVKYLKNISKRRTDG